MTELHKQNPGAIQRGPQLTVGAGAEQAGSWHLGIWAVRKLVVPKD